MHRHENGLSQFGGLIQLGLLAVGFVLWCCGTALAQQSPQSTFAQETRSQVNQGAVRLIAGEWGSTSLRIASDLAAVLDETGGLRILPIVGKGSVQNITDLLYLRGIDLCIIQADVLDFVVDNRIHTTSPRRIRYITKLHNEEFHLLVRKDIWSFQDLADQPVNIGPQGSGSAVTATAAFETLGLRVQPSLFDPVLALEKLRAGEIAALAYVTGKPAAFFRQITQEDGLRLLSIPVNADLLSAYAPASLEHRDYPRLIDPQRPVQTFAVGVVLAVYNWDRRTLRYRRAAQFVDALFGGFPELLAQSRHPKWREINLAASVPGWTRFAPAQEWLDKRSGETAEAAPHLAAEQTAVGPPLGSGN